MFEKMLTKLQRSAVEKVFNTTFTIEEQRGNQSVVNVRFSKADASQATAPVQQTPQDGRGIAPGMAPEGPPPGERGPQRPVVAAPKVSPNDPCPCGSGKKFKKCHG
ncbi:MAG: SEC-C domain-containing protein [Fibrobacteres bacterium]|nr:SEC-C domain-containing protein [Fibrobacterota bacterium]